MSIFFQIYEWLVQRLWQERGRWFLWWPVGMGLGICIYSSLYYNPNTFSWFCLGLVTFVGLYSWRSGGMIILSIIWGFVAMHYETYRLSTPMLKHSLKNQKGEAIIDDIEWRQDAVRLTCTLIDHPTLKRARFKTTFEKCSELKPSDIIRYEANFIPISPPVSSFAYDYRRACYFQGVGATGKIKEILQTHSTKESTLSSLRYTLTQQLRSALSGPEGEIAAALTTGDRSGIPPEIRQAYADAGIAHILAISGLHVSLVAGLIFILLRRCLGLIPWLSLHFPLKKIAAGSSLPFIMAYVAISGFGFPALRSLIMLAIVMIGIISDRPPFSMRSVMIAASVILSIWPSGLFGVSFQLSFMAVIGLLALYESRLDRKIRSILMIGHKRLWRSWLLYFLSIILTTIVATIVTTPFTIATFNRYTLQAILGNLIGIPLTGFWIMPLGLLSILSLTWGGSSWFFSLWGAGIQQLTKLACWVASLPGSGIIISTPYDAYLPFVTLAMLWLCLWRTSWRLASIPMFITAHIGLILWPYDVVLFAHPQGIAYIENKTLYTTKPCKFIDEQWAKTSGCLNISSWTSPWAVIGDHIVVQHPWLKGHTPPNLQKVMRQIVCRWPDPYPNTPKTVYRSKGYGLTPHQMARATFLVRHGGEVVYLNSKRSPYRPWS